MVHSGACAEDWNRRTIDIIICVCAIGCVTFYVLAYLPATATSMEASCRHLSALLLHRVDNLGSIAECASYAVANGVDVARLDLVRMSLASSLICLFLSFGLLISSRAESTREVRWVRTAKRIAWAWVLVGIIVPLVTASSSVRACEVMTAVFKRSGGDNDLVGACLVDLASSEQYVFSKPNRWDLAGVNVAFTALMLFTLGRLRRTPS